MPPTPADLALALVHEGWAHLKHERPLAAWASWRRALQIDPDQPAAKAALDRLANAPDLPASARREYRFRPPAGEARRARWDAKLRDRDLTDLAAAASAFAELAEEDPTDPDSAYNAGLCLAWVGREDEANFYLLKAADRSFATDEEAAIQAALLAEVLRQAHGYVATFDLKPDQTEAIELTEIDDPEAVIEALEGHATLRRIPSPVDPSVDPSRGTVTVAEILDKPWPEPRETPLRLDEVPRVVAVVLGAGNKLRFSSVSGGLGTIRTLLLQLGIKTLPPIESPLPLALLDAAVWLIRPPDWVVEESRQRLYRENVEDYYENRWVVTHRIDETPEQPGFRARLEAMIRLREELAARPSAVALYQGYPFDRLRHRLGLPPRDPAAIDPIEIGFMTGAELDALDVAALDDHALADAYRSAVPLGDIARAERFAAELVERRAEATHDS
jgi:tetratricopeptide (TPR) repeat protein